MATSQPAELKPKAVRIELPGRMRLVTKDQFVKVMRAVAAAAGLRLQVDGAQSAAGTADGAALRLLPGGDTAAHPFKGERRDGSLWIRGGYVNTLEKADVNIGASSTGVAWVKLEFTLSTEFDFVFTATLAAATLEYGSALPADDGALAVFHLPLFTYTSGFVTSQSVTQDLIVRACDNGAGTSTAELNVIQS